MSISSTIAAATLSLLINTNTGQDVINAEILGKTAVDSGYATDYKLGYNRVDVFMGDNSIHNARVLANVLCTVGKRKFKFEVAPTVRVFIVSGDRPAATCKAG